MKFSNLERASEWEVRDWLIKSLDLTPYQKEKLNNDELIRFSSFYFYKRKKKNNISFLWRLSLIIFPIYWLTLLCFLPIFWMFTGKWGYGRNFIDNFHTKWVNKLGL